MLHTLFTIGFTLNALLQAPARDSGPAREMATGTASISGVVTLGDDALTPVRRAVVTLTGSNGDDARSTVTDDDGRFSLTRLPEGTYALQAEKAAHLTMAYGARRPGRRGTNVVLSDAQHLFGISLALPRGGVLAGRLTFADGHPVPNVEVVAVPFRLATAGGTPSPLLREFRTDDDGNFRIYGLAPDSYIVGALPRFGRGEIERRTTVENDAILRMLSQPAAPGSTGRAPGPAPSGLVGFAAVYFPGTSMASEAQPIVLRTGEVRDDLSFTVALLPMATVSGMVTDANGQPVQAASITVEASGPPLPLEFAVTQLSLPDANGHYSIAGLAPGHYVVRARAGGVTLGEERRFSVNSVAQTQWARAELTISGLDVDGVPLTLGPGLSFTGSLTGDPPPTSSWLGTVVNIQPVRQGVNTAMAGLTGGVTARQATVDADGRFSVTGLEPDVYEIQVRVPSTLTSRGWTLAGVRHQGRDLRDAPLTFTHGSVEGVEVVLTTTVTELSGRLTLESGGAATDYFVVVFPADRDLWHAVSPRTALIRPSVDGRFATRSLPHGSYRLAALLDVEAHELRDRSFLESIYEASLAVVLTEGQTTVQDVRIK